MHQSGVRASGINGRHKSEVAHACSEEHDDGANLCICCHFRLQAVSTTSKGALRLDQFWVTDHFVIAGA